MKMSPFHLAPHQMVLRITSHASLSLQLSSLKELYLHVWFAAESFECEDFTSCVLNESGKRNVYGNKQKQKGGSSMHGKL